jgi:hypothetical protein
MLNILEATSIVHKNLPNGNIKAFIDYQDLFIFQVFTDDDLEGQFDPFFSVNKETGDFRDFSILTDGDTQEIAKLFLQAGKPD